MKPSRPYCHCLNAPSHAQVSACAEVEVDFEGPVDPDANAVWTPDGLPDRRRARRL